MNKTKLLMGTLAAFSVMALTVGFTMSPASADSGRGRGGDDEIRIRLDNNLFDDDVRVRLEARDDGLIIRREVRLDDALLNDVRLNDLRVKAE